MQGAACALGVGLKSVVFEDEQRAEQSLVAGACDSLVVLLAPLRRVSHRTDRRASAILGKSLSRAKLA